MMVHVVHADGHEADYELAMKQFGSLRNVMQNPNGVLRLADGSLVRPTDWMKATVVREKAIRGHAKFVALGYAEYAKVMEAVGKVIEEDSECASKSMLTGAIVRLVGYDEATHFITSMTRRRVIKSRNGTRRGFPIVFDKGPMWDKDWLDSHHEGPVTYEYVRERNE